MNDVERARAGGHARAKALTPARRSEIATNGARTRWSKWAKQQPEGLTLESRDGDERATYSVFVDHETGGMRLDNAGPFPAKEVHKLIRWAIKNYGRPQKETP